MNGTMNITMNHFPALDLLHQMGLTETQRLS